MRVSRTALESLVLTSLRKKLPINLDQLQAAATTTVTCDKAADVDQAQSMLATVDPPGPRVLAERPQHATLRIWDFTRRCWVDQPRRWVDQPRQWTDLDVMPSGNLGRMHPLASSDAREVLGGR